MVKGVVVVELFRSPYSYFFPIHARTKRYADLFSHRHSYYNYCTRHVFVGNGVQYFIITRALEFMDDFSTAAAGRFPFADDDNNNNNNRHHRRSLGAKLLRARDLMPEGVQHLQ